MAKRQSPNANMDGKIDRMLEMAAVPEVAPDVYRNISGMLTSSLEPVKRIPSTRAMAAQCVSLFLVFAVGLVALMGVAGLRMMIGWQVGILGILAAGIVLLSLVLTWQIRPGSNQRVSAPLSWACFAVGFLTGAALLFPWRGAEAFVSRGWPCLMMGSAAAIPGAIVFWLLCRRGAPLSPVAFGATLGATAGLLGLTVLQFRCTHQDALHLMVWHGGVLLLATAAGAFVALLAMRTRRGLAAD